MSSAGNWTNSWTVVSSNFSFKNPIFINVKIKKKKDNIHVDSETLIAQFEMKKKHRLPDYSVRNYFFTYSLITFRHCYCAKKCF